MNVGRPAWSIFLGFIAERAQCPRWDIGIAWQPSFARLFISKGLICLGRRVKLLWSKWCHVLIWKIQIQQLDYSFINHDEWWFSCHYCRSSSRTLGDPPFMVSCEVGTTCRGMLQEFWTQLDILIIFAGVIQIILDAVGLKGDRPLDVTGTMDFFNGFPYLGNMFIPLDEFIFFRGVGSMTNQ